MRSEQHTEESVPSGTGLPFGRQGVTQVPFWQVCPLEQQVALL
jgi:hypothetical protein